MPVWHGQATGLLSQAYAAFPQHAMPVMALFVCRLVLLVPVPSQAIRCKAKGVTTVLRSMTGFGRSVIEDAEWTQTWEVKSVNSRHLDLKWRLPSLARGFEARFEKLVRAYASRGRIEIYLNLDWRGSEKNVSFDQPLAVAMLHKVQSLADSKGLGFEPDLNVFFSIPSLWAADTEDSDDALFTRLEAGLVAVLHDWNESRETEAKALAHDLNARLLHLEEWVSLIAEQAPDIREDRFRLLRERVTEVLASVHTELDETRLLHEMVILTDKLDVSEELTRLGAHLERFRELLHTGADAGRRLDFTLQECFREITTCGNKIQHAQLSRVIVDCKNELEKCREQVQNLE